MNDEEHIARVANGEFTPEESMALADRILLEAGWTPPPFVVAQGGAQIANTEGRFAFANIVCGAPPPGAQAVFAVKELSKVPQAMAASMGLDPADYPDEHHEAAQWLVARFPANALSTAATLETPAAVIAEPEPEVSRENEAGTKGYESVDAAAGGPVHEPASEQAEFTGSEAEILEESSGRGDVLPVHEAETLEGEFADFGEGPADPEPEDLGAELLDTDYVRDPLLLEGEENEAPATDEPAHTSGEDIVRVYGLDDLDRRKTVAIGLVWLYAEGLTPAWTAENDARLAELRNFSMGVAEGRWPDDAGQREELDTLEATLRLIRRVERARDEKIAFIKDAGREAFDAFVVEHDWP